ncbi:MAG TPA: glycosyltransferase family 2 protein [Thermoanaerobaculia bacterium]|jgi:cellulose synthase/poly-beta-1,6-N-acetylglucosamine synthase-like glycosyltransferase
MILAVTIFWFCFTVCVYIYFGYPALLFLLSRLRPKPVQEADVTPRATFVVCAYNEESTIAEKIRNTLSLDYPAEQIEVLVVSNGSTDRTNEIVANWGDPRVRLIALEEPGKMRALNEGAAAASGEILVISDADFFLEHGTLRRMARKFADPSVGGVCGARKSGMKREGDATGEGEGLYAQWDKLQKALESTIGSVFAADGLLYAIRKELYVPITNPGQADDITVSVQIPLRGYRLLFDPEATAWEKGTVHAKQEFRRKVRITNRSIRALLSIGPRLLTSGFYSVELVSHKLVRHFIPVFLIPMLLANIPLALRSPFYRFLLAGQLGVYGLGAVGALLRDTEYGRIKLFSVPYYFCFVNTAALLGVMNLFRGQQTHSWASRAAAAPATTTTSAATPPSV